MRGLNLADRAILVVAFPLLCQIVFAGVLAYMLSGLHSDIAREHHSREIIFETHLLGHEIIQGTIAFIEACQITQTFDQNVGARQRQVVEKHLKKVYALTSKSPYQQQNIDDLREHSDSMLAIYQAASQRDLAPGRSMGLSTAQFQHALKVIHSMLQSISDVIIAEEKHGSVGLKVSQNMRERIKGFLFLGQAAGLLMAFLMAFFYAEKIRKPLKHISENSGRLSEGKPLLPPLKDKDELGELDRLVHSVAHSVESALANERQLFDQAADLIGSLSSDGVFTKVNSFAARLLGYEPEELLGKLLIELVSPEDIHLADEHLRASKESKENVFFELKLVRKNGETVETRWSCFWSSLDESLFCVVQDITEQKRVERLKDDFVGMISHDLRSPLMSLLSSTSMLAAGARGALSAEQISEVEKVSANVEILIALVNDLLDFQKLRSGKVELDLSECDLATILKDSVELVRRNAEQKNVEIKVPGGSWHLLCDKNKILQTVVNLLSNAIKFTEPDTSVEVSLTATGDSIEMTVSDCGPGVPQEFVDTIFEAFEQVPNSKEKEGTGLGLAICKLAVEAHGGWITAANKDNAEGAVFTLSLPLSPAIDQGATDRTEDASALVRTNLS